MRIIPSIQEHSPQGPAVMVVSDAPLMREAIAGALRPAGYRVVKACSAQEARQLAQVNPPIDLLVVDLSIPNLSYMELAAAFPEAHPGSRVLALSPSLWELTYRVGDRFEQRNGSRVLTATPTPATLVDTVSRMFN